MLQQGTDIKTISTRLGHSSVTFTMDTYAHLLPGMQKAAMEKFEEALAVTGQNSPVADYLANKQPPENQESPT